jgi:hypothetical protein
MQDSFSIRNNTGRPQAGEEPGKPLALLWIFKAVNPIMKVLLRSPLHLFKREDQSHVGIAMHERLDGDPPFKTCQQRTQNWWRT